jgi:hypothetical protein
MPKIIDVDGKPSFPMPSWDEYDSQPDPHTTEYLEAQDVIDHPITLAERLQIEVEKREKIVGVMG